ncbi:MAG: hypothetical protein HQ567_22495 [Candidatus Nealsonbacteria bacterium]|nr:hypothetical protein [Candidatus Nealsonbacteria bacterium]
MDLFSDPFRLCLALGPVVVYVLLLGALNLSRRPLLVSGTRDAAALGLAVSGFVIIGPIELFFPQAAAATFGTFVWVLLLTFYALCVLMVLLLLRPRLIIYNVSADQLRPILAELVEDLDPDARWAGDTLVLPGLGIQLHVDNAAPIRTVSLNSVGSRQNYLGWRRLELALRTALEEVDVVRNPRSLLLLGTAGAIATLLVVVIYKHPDAVAQAMLDIGQALQKMVRGK